jgi:hypothetical protein
MSPAHNISGVLSVMVTMMIVTMLPQTVGFISLLLLSKLVCPCSPGKYDRGVRGPYGGICCHGTQPCRRRSITALKIETGTPC